MFELFKMKENETIAKMITRFTNIMNSLVDHGKEYTNVEKVKKVLPLTSNWEKKTIAIEEANNPSTLTLENPTRNFMTYEVQLKDRKYDEQQPKKKVLAFNTSSDTEDSNNEEDYISIISRKFKKFLR